MEKIVLDNVPWSDPLSETDDYYIFFDKFPVSAGHKLFVPKYNTQDCIGKCLVAAYTEGAILVNTTNETSAQTVPAFNVGMNCGTEAGQTVPWPHVHMIPRYSGDMDDPRGGVRGVIPNKQNYKVVTWPYNKETGFYDYPGS